MSIEMHVKAGRREAEKLMTTTCTISRATGEVYTDPDTLEEVPVYAIIYTGKCRISSRSNAVNDAALPGIIVARQSLQVSLPIAATEPVTTNDVLNVTANPLDAALNGTSYRITGTSAQTNATARRFEIERTS